MRIGYVENFITIKIDRMKSNTSQLATAKNTTKLVIVINVGIALLLSTILWWMGFAPQLALLVGVAGWSLIILKTPVFDWFVINVENNWVVILGNRLEYDKVPDKPAVVVEGTPDPRTKMYELKSLREVGPGYNGKFPWEIQFESVHLRSEVIIGDTTNEPLICYTSDNITLEVTWQVVLTPLRGFCVNLVRKGEEATQAFFKGEFQQAIINWIKESKESEIAGMLPTLNGKFVKVCGGPDQISVAEENHGVFTNSPQILTIKRSASYQKAAEAEQVAVRMKKVIAALRTKLGPDADSNMILAAAAAITGNSFDGLLLIPGLGKDPKALAAIANVAGAFGVKAKGGKKGTP